MSTPTSAAAAAPDPEPASRPEPTVVRLRAAVLVELAKLRAHPVPRAVLGLALIGPSLMVAALLVQAGLPKDSLFGRQVQDSGLAPSLVLLGFSGQWLLPLLVALVGGGLVAEEDRHGTWATVLTRSCSRSTLLRAKVTVTACWTALLVAVLAGASLLAGLLLVGTEPLLNLSGAPVPAGRGSLLVLLAWASVLPPALAVGAMAVLFAVLSRSMVVAIGGPVVVSLVMVLLLLVPGLGPPRHLLLASSFLAWHGLLVEPVHLWPLLRATLVSLAYFAACLPPAFAVLRGRDITDG